MAVAGHDDVYAMGPEGLVLPAVQRFAAEILERCGLRLQWSKSKVSNVEGTLPDNTPAGLTVAGEVINGQFEPGMDCYGCPIGSDNFVRNMLQCRAEEIMRDAVKSVDLLAGDRQALWSVLRLSISNRFGYFCQLVPPSLVEPVAKWLDSAVWERVLQPATGLTIPRGHGGETVISCPVTSLDNLSFQEWVIRLPVKQYGWGIRKMEETCGPAFI